MKGRAPIRFNTLVLPAVIAQSMIIGGGYATGREVVEYAGRFGARGWLAVAIIAVCFAAVMALAFELARLAGAYDYKSWCRNLVGPFWWLVDLLFLAMTMLVIAVMTASIGEVLRQTLAFPRPLSLALALAAVGFMAWRGAGFIERAKTWGSAALYLGYLAFSLLVLTAPVGGAAGPATPAPVGPEPGTMSVVLSALLYVGYNVAVVPAVLFCLHRQTRRAETAVSGLLAGLAMTIPFALTLACLLRFPHPSVVDAEVPWLRLIDAAADGRAGGAALWTAIFGLVVGWTLIETAVGSIHALVHRVERNLDDLPARWRPAAGKLSPQQKAATAVLVLAAAAGLSTIGIIDLVARGYGAMAWGFIVLILLPLLVVVPYRAWTAARG